MLQFDEKSKIDSLKDSLYSPNVPDVRTRRKLRYADQESDVKKTWGDEKPPDDIVPAPEPVSYEDHHMSFLTKLLIGSFVFCILAIGVGASYLTKKGLDYVTDKSIKRIYEEGEEQK